jgi:hypothetical protein
VGSGVGSRDGCGVGCLVGAGEGLVVGIGEGAGVGGVVGAGVLIRRNTSKMEGKGDWSGIRGEEYDIGE